MSANNRVTIPQWIIYTLAEGGALCLVGLCLLAGFGPLIWQGVSAGTPDYSMIASVNSWISQNFITLFGWAVVLAIPTAIVFFIAARIKQGAAYEIPLEFDCSRVANAGDQIPHGMDITEWWAYQDNQGTGGMENL